MSRTAGIGITEPIEEDRTAINRRNILLGKKMTISMKKPGTDLSDPKTLSGAKSVATRKNNAFKKMVETKFPLFSAELFEVYEPVTPEKVVEDRAALRNAKFKKSLIRKICRSRTLRSSRTIRFR